MWCAKGKTHSVNGDPSVSDKHCASVFGHAACVGFAQQQKVRPSWTRAVPPLRLM
jgi:hypothetical protein